SDPNYTLDWDEPGNLSTASPMIREPILWLMKVERPVCFSPRSQMERSSHLRLPVRMRRVLGLAVQIRHIHRLDTVAHLQRRLAVLDLVRAQLVDGQRWLETGRMRVQTRVLR